MAKNLIQLRKPLIVNDFIEQHATEKRCADALLGWRWSYGFLSPQCGHADGVAGPCS